MAKNLTAKQQKTLELLTNGQGLSYKEVCELVDINMKTLWRWRNEPEFAQFQEKFKELNDERWAATVDAARDAARRLVEKENQKMVEFVLRTAGHNPTQKVEAELSSNININICD